MEVYHTATITIDFEGRINSSYLFEETDFYQMKIGETFTRKRNTEDDICLQLMYPFVDVVIEVTTRVK